LILIVLKFCYLVQAQNINKISESSFKMSDLINLTPHKIIPLNFQTNTGTHFLSATSGLVHVGNKYFMIADDDLNIGSMNEDGSKAILKKILPGELPRDEKERKKKKPDFESLVRISDDRLAGEGLIAFPSGSKPNRFLAIFIPMTNKGKLDIEGLIRFDVSPFLNSILKQNEHLNIEGVIIENQKLILFHRGNTDGDENRIFEFKKSDLVDLILGKNKETLFPIAKSEVVDLGNFEGVKLTLTDATFFEGRQFFLAAAENTSNAIDDGEIKGTVLGEFLGPGHIRIISLFKKQKFEGLSLQRSKKTIKLSLVTDNDDPTHPSNLYLFKLKML